MDGLEELLPGLYIFNQRLLTAERMNFIGSSYLVLSAYNTPLDCPKVDNNFEGGIIDFALWADKQGFQCDGRYWLTRIPLEGKSLQRGVNMQDLIIEGHVTNTPSLLYKICFEGTNCAWGPIPAHDSRIQEVQYVYELFCNKDISNLPEFNVQQYYTEVRNYHGASPNKMMVSLITQVKSKLPKNMLRQAKKPINN